MKSIQNNHNDKIELNQKIITHQIILTNENEM